MLGVYLLLRRSLLLGTRTRTHCYQIFLWTYLANYIYFLFHFFVPGTPYKSNLSLSSDSKRIKYLTIFLCMSVYKGYLPNSETVAIFDVFLLTAKIFLQIWVWNFSHSDLPNFSIFVSNFSFVPQIFISVVTTIAHYITDFLLFHCLVFCYCVIDIPWHLLDDY